MARVLRRVVHGARSIRWSLLACVVGMALGLLGMGALGLGLYYAAWPLLGPWHGNPDGWSGDWVWPAMIGAGMLWPLSFLPAAWAHAALGRRGHGLALRRLAYAAVLWLGAALAWWILLATRHLL